VNPKELLKEPHPSVSEPLHEVHHDGQFKIVWTAPEPVRPEAYPTTRSAEAWRAFLHDLYTGWGDRWSAPEDAKAKATGQ
jgi:hypothetical protein